MHFLDVFGKAKRACVRNRLDVVIAPGEKRNGLDGFVNRRIIKRNRKLGGKALERFKFGPLVALGNTHGLFDAAKAARCVLLNDAGALN